MKNNKQDLAVFSKIMWALSEEFGGKISNDSLEMRFMALQEYSIEQVGQAGTWLLKHREKTFPPVPTTKEIIDVIEGFSSPKIDLNSKAKLQAAHVLDCLRRFGAVWQNPHFEDRITSDLMRSRWPWHNWAKTVKECELTWWENDFVELYQAQSKHDSAVDMALSAPCHAGAIDLDKVKALACSAVGTI